MPNVPVFINKKQIMELDKLCKTKGCNRYQFCKGAVVHEIERLKEIEREKPENESRPNTGRPVELENDIRDAVNRDKDGFEQSA